MASTVLATIAATMSLTFMRTSWKSPFLRPASGRDDVDEDVADRRAGLVGDLQALELLDLGDVEVLARDDLRGLADIFDHRDGDEAALVVADDEGLARIGADVDLARHHLLHGEVAGRHREFLELDAALLQQPGLAAGSRSACPRCWSGSPAGWSRARPPARHSEARRQHAGAGRGQILSSRHSIVLGHCVLLHAGRSRFLLADHCSCCMPNSRMLAATSSRVCVITCCSSSGVDDTAHRAGLLDQRAVVGRIDDRRDLAVEQIDDRLRRAGAGADAEPAEAHEVMPFSFTVGISGALSSRSRARDRDDLEQLAVVLLHDRQRRRDVEVHASGDQLLHDLRAAAERDAVHRDAGELLELARQDFLRRAGADGRVADLARTRLGVLHELLEVLGRNRVGQREPVVVFGDQRDRGDVAQLEAGILVDRGVDRLEMGAEQQGVAVARLRQHVPGRDHAGRRRLVLHHHALAERVAELVGDEACRNIGRPAGAEADHQPDRPRRIGVGGARRTGAPSASSARPQHAQSCEPCRPVVLIGRMLGFVRAWRTVSSALNRSAASLLPEMAQQLLLIVQELDAERVARPRERGSAPRSSRCRDAGS